MSPGSSHIQQTHRFPAVGGALFQKRHSSEHDMRVLSFMETFLGRQTALGTTKSLLLHSRRASHHAQPNFTPSQPGRAEGAISGPLCAATWDGMLRKTGEQSNDSKWKWDVMGLLIHPGCCPHQWHVLMKEGQNPKETSFAQDYSRKHGISIPPVQTANIFELLQGHPSPVVPLLGNPPRCASHTVATYLSSLILKYFVPWLPRIKLFGYIAPVCFSDTLLSKPILEYDFLLPQLWLPCYLLPELRTVTGMENKVGPWAAILSNSYQFMEWCVKLEGLVSPLLTYFMVCACLPCHPPRPRWWEMATSLPSVVTRYS